MLYNSSPQALIFTIRKKKYDGAPPQSTPAQDFMPANTTSTVEALLAVMEGGDIRTVIDFPAAL